MKFVRSAKSLTVMQTGTLSVLEIYSDASKNYVYQDCTREFVIIVSPTGQGFFENHNQVV